MAKLHHITWYELSISPNGRKEGGGAFRPIWANLRFCHLINIGLSYIYERPISKNRFNNLINEHDRNYKQCGKMGEVEMNSCIFHRISPSTVFSSFSKQGVQKYIYTWNINQFKLVGYFFKQKTLLDQRPFPGSCNFWKSIKNHGFRWKLRILKPWILKTTDFEHREFQTPRILKTTDFENYGFWLTEGKFWNFL